MSKDMHKEVKKWLRDKDRGALLRDVIHMQREMLEDMIDMDADKLCDPCALRELADLIELEEEIEKAL